MKNASPDPANECVLVLTNLYYSEAPWLTPRTTTAAQGLIWKEVALSGNSAHEFEEQLTEHTRSTVWTTYITVAIGLLLNLAFAMWIGLSGLSHPIDRLKKVMQAFANNDLSAEVPGTSRRTSRKPRRLWTRLPTRSSG